MAENKNAIVNETANESGNAAITERLDSVAERVAEAAKATQTVAEEHSLRRDEQEQHAQRLQKEEEERRAQAAETAKSVANRRAAVLDYTENYRQNQKIAKAARATVSKAKLERLAAEAEAKARAEREAEEALAREREELMARRNRSTSLLNKMDNDSEAEAPVAKSPVAAPAEEAMPEAEISALETEVPVSQEAAPDAEDAPVQDDTPDILDINIDASADADDAASASDEEAFADESDEDDDIIFVDDRSEEIDAAIEKVDNDLKVAKAEAQEQMEREAEAAKTVDNDLAKVRVAGIMPAHLIPDSLRLHTASAAPNRPSVNTPTGIEGAMQRLEDALVAAALHRIDSMARRIDPSTGGSNGAAAAAAGAIAGAALATRSMPKTQAGLADAAVNAGLVSGDVLPAAYDARAFDKRELRRYKKSMKREISEKRKALKAMKKNPGESAEDFEYRRLERRAALLGTEFGAIALLSSKGHLNEAEAFKKNAEKDVRAYNKSIAKYNRSAMQPLTPLPQNVVARIASERKLPENLPFGSAATGLDATLSGGVNEEASKNAAQTEQDALRKEMQKQMLLHAMVWNPAVASAVQGMVASIYAEENGNATAASATASAKSFDQLSAEQKRLLSDYEQALGADAAFLKNDLQRLEYYENRLAMIDVKRNELDEFYTNTKHLPQKTRRTVCAERRLGLIKEELALLGLLNRYPNDRIAERCRQGCEVDIAEYNRLIAGIPPKERATEPLSMMLPAHVLARGVDASTASLMLPEDSMPTGDEDPFAPHRMALLVGLVGSDTQSETMRKAQEIREDEILQAAARQNREYDAAIERITNDYERTIREYNEAAKEADQLAAENADAPATAEAKERAEELGARADEEAQKLALLYTAKEAADRSEEMSKARKAEMLALAAAAASDEKNAKAAKKLKKYAIAESRKADKAVARAEERDWKNVEIWEQSLASAEAKALAAEMSAQDAGENAARLLAEKACNSELHAAYGEALRENSKAGSARRSADVIQGKREAEKKSIANKREARDAMLAFAAAMEIEEAMPEKRPLSKRESRKLDAAIQKANEGYENARLAAADAEAAFLRMKEEKEDSDALRAAQRYTATLREDAAHAEEKLAALNAAKSAAEKSRIMSKEERAEMLSLAIATAETDDEKAVERLQRQVALAVKKEDRAEKRAILKAERDLKRGEERLADAEARAQIAEQAALNARSRAEALSVQKADKNALRHAYEQALLEEKKAEDARNYVKAARAKHDTALERVESHKEAKAAMLAFAGALSVTDKKGEPEKKSAPSRAMRKLDAAIDEANASYERALKAEGVASIAQKRTAEQQTFVSADQATENVRTAAKKDRKRAAKAKKEELHKSYVAALAEDRKTEKADARTAEQKKKIIAEAETVAQRSEERAEVARARVKELSAKKAGKKELQAAYEQAMRAEAEAERARRYAERVKSSPIEEEKNKSESHKEAKAAMLAFAAAFAASEKKAKEQNARKDAPNDELKALDAAIAEANKNLEKAKAASADLKADEMSKTSRKGRSAEKETLKKNAKLAESRVDTLRTAKNAVERSRTLSREEKADMIALVMAFNADEASESTAKELSKKIAIAEKREADAIKKAAKTSNNGIVSTKRMAEAEAKAQLSEREAIAAKERVKILAEKNADKKALEEAYRQALQAEAKANRARKTAEKIKEEEVSKKESVASHKEARKAMLTFATAFAVANNDKAARQARKENEGRALATKQERALDAAILSANKRFERAEAEKSRATENLSENAEVRAARSERVQKAETEAKSAKAELETLKTAKRATKESKVLSSEEKAEMLALVMATDADAKAAAKLRKKIASAEKRETVAEKKADATKEYRTKWDKRIAEAEAVAERSEKKAKSAKETVKTLQAKKASQSELHAAYEQALQAETEAEQARKSADTLRQQRDDAESHKEAKAALLAFAVAFAASEKVKKEEAKKQSEVLVTKQERALDAAILSANKRFERAETEKRSTQERVSKLSDKKASKSERKAARKALVNADDKVKQASTTVETLERAKEATKKSKVLSLEEKADMLALVIATNADARDVKSAEKLKKKIDAAVKKEEKAESLHRKAETARAEDRLDTLRTAKTAMNRSHALSSEEKADMIALVMAANADERDAATAAKLRKKIAAAEKREALAARQTSKSTRRISNWEKRVAETEAAAQVAEKNAAVAKERVKTLSEKKTEKQTLYDAYEQAMRAEAKAEQARKSADEVKKQYTAKQQSDESHKEAKAALVAFAAAFALSEKNKKAKKVREGTASVSRQERKLDAAITSANKSFERAEAKKSAAQERVSELSAKTAARSERKAARKEYIYAAAESERASARLETLKSAKEATKKSKALSREEKAEMLALVIAANADARDAKTAERLKKKVSDAVAKETVAEKKAVKRAAEKQTALENKHLDREAAKHASEEAAWEAKQRADRLQKENADTKELHKAYKLALVEEARAEKARRAAEQSRAMCDASEKNTKSNKEAKAAMLAFAAAVAAEEKVKKETGVLVPVYGRAASSVDALISDAERQYEKALAAKLASKEKVRELAATKATRRERAVAFEEAVRDEVAFRKASERVQSLKSAKQTAEKSESLSREEKAEMLALVMAADADRRGAKAAEKIQKKANAVAKKAQAADRIAEENLKKASDAWEKTIASAEAQALVSEEAALNAKRKARSIRDEKPDRRALHRAYREALLEEANAERARKLADTARVERATAEKRPDDRRAAEAAMIAFAADMAAEREVASFARHAEKVQAAEQQRLAKRAAAHEIGIAEAEAYAHACEEKAAISEKKALLLAAEGGSKREKLKAYEAALLDKAAADKAKAKLSELQKQSDLKANAVLAPDLAQMKADLAQEDQRTEIEKVNDVNEKIRLAMMEKIRKADERGLRKQKEQSYDAEQSDESDALIKTYTREEIAEQEKRDIAALKKERIRLMMEEKIRRADKKGHRATAASAAREAVLADKRQRADEKAWNLLVKRDEELDRQRSYEEALRLAKQDGERTVLQKDASFTAFSSMPAAALSKRAMAKRIKEFNERDIATLTARYDSEMAEAKRSLEVGLCDLSCTAAMARRLKKQTAVNLRKLRRKKRAALRLEKEDNKRYFACVRDVLQPKDVHDAALLAEHRERIFRLLEHRDYENTHLTSLYLADTFNGVTQKRTPWHKAFLHEKKRWHRKLRKHVRKVGEMNLSRHDKQKLRVEIDRVATANADIAEARCRARRLKVRGLALDQYRQEMVEMNREVRRTRRNLRRKMKAARAKEDYRNFWKVSILSLILTAALVVGGMYLWQQYGDQILSYLNANFPNIMSQLK